MFKNKKAELVLRDMIFMLLIFAGIMTFGTLLVLDMGTTYGNNNMTGEWAGGGLNNTGFNLLVSLNNDSSTMVNATSGGGKGGGIVGTIGTLTGVIQGIGTVLKIIILSPVYFSNNLGDVLLAIGVPNMLVLIIKNFIMIGIYAVVIFTIITIAMKGGKA